MTKDEALKLALEAFGEIEWSNNSQWQSCRAKVAITAIKEALAQQALDRKAENARELGLDYEPENTLHWHALNYRTAPTQNAQAMFEALERFVAQQGRVTYAGNGTSGFSEGERPTGFFIQSDKRQQEPEYLAFMDTPQRTWVGLTQEEIYSVLENLQVMYNRPPTTDSRIIFARAIEAKLKEKNT